RVHRQVREAFFAAALAKSFTSQQEQVTSLAQRLKGIAQARFDAGDVPQLEVLQADLEVARAEADLEVAREQQKVAGSQLSMLLNEPGDTDWDLVTPLETMPPSQTLTELVQRAVTSNPDLQHLAQEAKVERSHTSTLRAGRIPDVSLEAGADFNAPLEYRAGARAQISVGLPLFSRNQGELEQSSATLRAIEGETLAMRRSVAGEVEASWYELNSKVTQVVLYRDKVLPVGKQLQDLAEQSYQLGRTNILTVLDAQRAAQQNERDYLQSLFDLQQAFAALEEVVGVNLN
ncbi:MAG: TolC family protein, partial [Bryobacteraceae bacterium]